MRVQAWKVGWCSCTVQCTVRSFSDLVIERLCILCQVLMGVPASSIPYCRKTQTMYLLRERERHTPEFCHPGLDPFSKSSGDGGMDFSSFCKQNGCIFALCPPANDLWHPWPFFQRLYDAQHYRGTRRLWWWCRPRSRLRRRRSRHRRSSWSWSCNHGTGTHRRLRLPKVPQFRDWFGVSWLQCTFKHIPHSTFRVLNFRD